jgi:hypothetical protein
MDSHYQSSTNEFEHPVTLGNSAEVETSVPKYFVETSVPKS